jgi:putative membrane protein
VEQVPPHPRPGRDASADSEPVPPRAVAGPEGGAREASPAVLQASDERGALVWLALVAAATVASGISPRDRLTWSLDILPVLVVVPVFVALRRRVPLTPLVHALLALFSLALALGSHYTFAQVPAGLWVQDAFDLGRNPYDRFVHFSSGLVGSVFVRELLLRKTRLRPAPRFTWIVSGIVLGLSAAYEILEWAAVVLFGGEAERFLATQGDAWDPQWDMFSVLLGTCLAHLALRRAHDAQLAARLGPGKFGPPE